ncbi:hypothetical protein HC02_29440 [Vibrio parahaemolyticus]|nr:hypothetical protein HC02_29440 [Vibrio parahaemolyticus]
MTHSVVLEVTQRLTERSREARAAFLARTEVQAEAGKGRIGLSCGNLAHAVAASCSSEKKNILDFTHANVALISAYNDMLSATSRTKTIQRKSNKCWRTTAIQRKSQVVCQRCAMG